MASTAHALAGRFFDHESDHRRVVILDSATHVTRHVEELPESTINEVVVNASYAGVYCAHLIQRAQPIGVIGVDCGVGKDGAGIAGLWFFEALGIPAAAANVATVELGNGRDLYDNGVISKVNSYARALGIEIGATVREAARILVTQPTPLPELDNENRLVVEEGPFGHNVVATNSIADALPEDKDTNVLCTAGHTGRSVVDYILGFRPYGFICSDGGPAKNDSGLSALPLANDAGIPGASVSADTARMGDGQSTYFDGVISAVNELAAEAGVRVGQTAQQAAHLLVDRSEIRTHSSAELEK